MRSRLAALCHSDCCRILLGFGELYFLACALAFIRLKIGITWPQQVSLLPKWIESGGPSDVSSRGMRLLSQWFGVGLAVAAVKRRRDIIRARLFPTHLHTMPRGALVSCVSLETMRTHCLTIQS